MKKILTLKNVVLFGGALLLLVAFFLSFGASFSQTNGSQASVYNNIIWGCDKMILRDGSDVHTMPVKGTITSGDRLLPSGVLLAGIIMMLVGAIGAVVIALFLKKPFAKWIVLGFAAIALAGAIMQFFALDSFAHAIVDTMKKDYNGGVTDAEYQEALAQAKSNLSQYNGKSVMCIIMGILGLLGSLAAGASIFLPEKELLK